MSEEKPRTSTIFIMNDACFDSQFSHEYDFMTSMSEIYVTHTDRNHHNLPPEEWLPFNVFFGRITLPGINEIIYLFAVVGNQHPHRVLKGFLERIMPLEKILGFVVLEASSSLTPHGVEAAKELAPHKPCVVAAINRHRPGALPLDEIRETLKPGENMKLIPCNPKDRESVKFILLKLLAMCEPTPRIERMKDTFEKL